MLEPVQNEYGRKDGRVELTVVDDVEEVLAQLLARLAVDDKRCDGALA